VIALGIRSVWLSQPIKLWHAACSRWIHVVDCEVARVRREDRTASVHNESTEQSNGNIVQAGTIGGSVYFGDAGLAQAQADALAVHRKLEASYQRLEIAQRQLLEQAVFPQPDPIGMEVPTVSVLVSYHQADQRWAMWIADTLIESGYRTVLALITDDLVHDTDQMVAVISPEYLVNAPVATARSSLVQVLVRECKNQEVLAEDHVDLVGVPVERARHLLLAGMKTDLLGILRPRRVPPPSVRVLDLEDPVELGVHLSAQAHRTGVRRANDTKVPPYVPRDADEQLAQAVSGSRFVVVVGDAAAGKTRLAYEVVRNRLPQHWVVLPQGLGNLGTALSQADQVRDCVVWLDDLERYLEPGGLTAEVVTALLRGKNRHVVLLCTMRTQEHAKLSPRWESRADGTPEKVSSRVGRDVLRLAHEVHLDRRWSSTELDRAWHSSDPRIHEALRHADAFGLGEYLATGPQLLAEWRGAWSIGVQPRGAALVTAAIDASRAGMRDGIGIDLLKRLHGHYLEAMGGQALSPEPFADALAWAVEPVRAASSLLVPAGRRRYRPSGYLVNAVTAGIDYPPVPDATWQMLISRAGRFDCWHIGEAAYARRRLRFAEGAFRRAADVNPAAELRVIDCVGESGRRRDALAALHILVDDRRQRHGAGHPDLLHAMQALGGWTGRVGDLRGAVEIFQDLVKEQSSTCGATHSDTLATRRALANWRGRAGDLPGATTEYQNLVRDLVHLFGPEHRDTLTARHELANWIGRSGDMERALVEHESVVAAQFRVLGADHPDTLRSRHRAARLTCEVLGTEIGLPKLHDVVADRSRTLGTSHPETLRSRAQFARWTGKAGRAAEAANLFEQLALDYDRALGPDHPDTLRGRHQQARWTGESGDCAQAVVLLEQIIADWIRLFGTLHPYTLISRYRLAECLHRSGVVEAAIDVLAELSADDMMTLGHNHPYTLHVRRLLSSWQVQSA